MPERPRVPELCVALDGFAPSAALDLAARIDPALARVKVGKELFTRGGPAVVERLQASGFEVFLDLKFHDIPNTVAGALRAAAELGVWMVNVHASGGPRMLEAARAAVPARATGGPWLIAVTVLTSFDSVELDAIGVARTVEQQVVSLASLTAAFELDGVVCSVHEIEPVRRATRDNFLTVTPGIRLTPSGDDQRRVATPVTAMASGADVLVIGRPITGATEPMAALHEIHASLHEFRSASDDPRPASVT